MKGCTVKEVYTSECSKTKLRSQDCDESSALIKCHF
jgi:hypothetical protein